MALNPNVVVVAPGELITAAHLNNIRANLVSLDTDVREDSGNVNITLHSAFNAAPFMVRKIGKQVLFVCNVGRASGSITDVTVTLGTIPVGYRPPVGMALPAITSTELPHRASIGADGVVQVLSLTITEGAALSMIASWPVP